MRLCAWLVGFHSELIQDHVQNACKGSIINGNHTLHEKFAADEFIDFVYCCLDLIKVLQGLHCETCQTSEASLLHYTRNYSKSGPV